MLTIIFLMIIKRIRRDTRAASSVISVILLVAIAVLLASTVSVFAFGIGFSDAVCNAGFGPELQSLTDPVC